MCRRLIITYLEKTGNVDFHLPEKKGGKKELTIHVAVGANSTITYVEIII